MEKEDTQKLQIQVSEETYRLVKALAALQGMSISEMCDEALSAHCKERIDKK